MVGAAFWAAGRSVSLHAAARTAEVHPDRMRSLARPSSWGLRVALADLRKFVEASGTGVPIESLDAPTERTKVAP